MYNIYFKKIPTLVKHFKPIVTLFHLSLRVPFFLRIHGLFSSMCHSHYHPLVIFMLNPTFSTNGEGFWFCDWFSHELIIHIIIFFRLCSYFTFSRNSFSHNPAQLIFSFSDLICMVHKTYYFSSLLFLMNVS